MKAGQNLFKNHQAFKRQKTQYALSGSELIRQEGFWRLLLWQIQSSVFSSYWTRDRCET